MNRVRRRLLQAMGAALGLGAAAAQAKRFMPIVAGPQITSTFTDVQIQPFLSGYFDTTTNANARTWDSDLSHFCAYITGSTAQWTGTSGGTFASPFWASVDGGPEFLLTLNNKTKGKADLFRNLQDKAHLVKVRADPAYSTNNARTPTDVPVLTVVGRNPAVSNGPDLGTAWHVLDTGGSSPLVTMFLYKAAPGGNFTPTYKVLPVQFERI